MNSPYIEYISQKDDIYLFKITNINTDDEFFAIRESHDKIRLVLNELPSYILDYIVKYMRSKVNDQIRHIFVIKLLEHPMLEVNIDFRSPNECVPNDPISDKLNKKWNVYDTTKKVPVIVINTITSDTRMGFIKYK